MTTIDAFALGGASAGGELRRRAEALAAEYAGALPAGDAGLIEAERRRRELAPRISALYREFQPSIDAEEEFIEPTVLACDGDLFGFINETAPESPAGVAVKLRCLLECECDQELTTAQALVQCIAALDRAGANNPN
jgi:hypothetical protein